MLSRDSLAIMAYEYIKAEIIALNFKSGEQIPEEKIADKLSMSRSPVRRAIKMLADEGFVRITKAKGATVTYITKDSIDELCDLRIMIECWALKRAINAIPDSELDRAEELFIRSAEHSSMEEHHKADRNLHNLILIYSNSLRAEKMDQTLELQTDWYKSKAEYNTDFSNSRREHIGIINAIRERDYEKARKALENHLNRVRHTFYEAYELEE